MLEIGFGKYDVAGNKNQINLFIELFRHFFRLFNPAGGGAIPISSNNPYLNNPAIPPAGILPPPNTGNPIPPHILMAAMQDR